MFNTKCISFDAYKLTNFLTYINLNNMKKSNYYLLDCKGSGTKRLGLFKYL